MLRFASPRQLSLDIVAPRIAICRPANTFTSIPLPSRESSSRSPQPRNKRRNTRYQQPTNPPVLYEKIKAHITALHSNGEGPSDSEVHIFNRAVSKLRVSLEKNDIRAACQHWSLLEERKLLDLLGPSQFDHISRAIAGIFNTNLVHVHNDVEAQTIEEIALTSAVGHAPDALSAAMVYHLKKNNPDAVLELDRRYTQLSNEKGFWKAAGSVDGDAEPEDPGYEALASTSTPEQGRTEMKNIYVQLAVTTAYAMKDSFEGALQALLATNLRTFTTFAVNSFLRKLKHNTSPSLRKKVEDYTRQLSTAKLIIRSPSFVKHIHNLAKDQSVKGLEKLYNAVIDGLCGPNSYLAAIPSAVDSKKVILVTEIAWTAFLSAFMKCQRTDLAEKLWDDVIRLGIRPGTSMWTALFDGYNNVQAITEVLNGWDTMLSEGVTPDALTYRALISALFHKKKPDEAMKRFRAFEKLRPSPTWESSHIMSVYNTVLRGLLHVSRETEAIAFLQAMKENGPKPDIVSYNTVLGHYGRRGDFKAVAAYVRDLASSGLVGDVFTFSTILSALLKVGREDAPEMMISFMKKQGVEPNVATYSAIIDQQMREQSEDNFRAALQLLQSMEQDPRTQPNEVTYTAILAGMYRGQWLDPRVAEEHRQAILQRMQDRDIRPNRVTYHILLKACLDYPEPEGLRSALHYHREMVYRRVSITQDTWYILLRGLTGRGEWEMASEMVKEMLKSGFQPTGALSELVNKIRIRARRRLRVQPSG